MFAYEQFGCISVYYWSICHVRISRVLVCWLIHWRSNFKIPKNHTIKCTKLLFWPLWFRFALLSPPHISDALMAFSDRKRTSQFSHLISSRLRYSHQKSARPGTKNLVFGLWSRLFSLPWKPFSYGLFFFGGAPMSSVDDTSLGSHNGFQSNWCENQLRHWASQSENSYSAISIQAHLALSKCITFAHPFFSALHVHFSVGNGCHFFLIFRCP